MAISRVGSASAASNTLTLPSGIQKRDLIIAFAGRESSTPSTIPSGWTQFYTGSASGRSLVGAFCFATGSGDAFGTWTNAEIVMCGVYRSTSSDNVVNVGMASLNQASNSTALAIPNIASMASLQRGGSSFDQWRVSTAFLTEATNAGSLSYTGMTVIQSVTNGVADGVLLDSGEDVSTGGYSTINVTISPAASNYAATLEIYETKFPADSSGGYYNPFRNPVFGG